MAGRKIDDHSFWAGKPEKGGVFPDASHKLKEYSSSEGSGHLSEYSDTSELVKRDQGHGNEKIKGRPMKPGYRY